MTNARTGRAARTSRFCSDSIQDMSNAFMEGRTEARPDVVNPFVRESRATSVKDMKKNLTQAYQTIVTDELLRLIKTTKKRRQNNDPEKYIYIDEIYTEYLRQQSTNSLKWLYKKSNNNSDKHYLELADGESFCL